MRIYRRLPRLHLKSYKQRRGIRVRIQGANRYIPRTSSFEVVEHLYRASNLCLGVADVLDKEPVTRGADAKRGTSAGVEAGTERVDEVDL